MAVSRLFAESLRRSENCPRKEAKSCRKPGGAALRLLALAKHHPVFAGVIGGNALLHRIVTELSER